MRWFLSLAVVLALPTLSLAEDVLCATYTGLRHGDFRYVVDAPGPVQRAPGEVCFLIPPTEREGQRLLWHTHARERLEVRRPRGIGDGRLHLRPPDVPRPALDAGRPAP